MRVELLVVRVTPLVVALAVACSASGSVIADRLDGQYELRQVGSRTPPLVYGDTAVDFRYGLQLEGATIEVAGESARLVRRIRPLQLNSWPCSALRAMRADEGRGGSGGMSLSAVDTNDTDCEELRLDYDSAEARVRVSGDSVWLYGDGNVHGPLPDTLLGVIRSDTLWLRVGPDGPGLAERVEPWVFVRSSARPAT